MTEERMIVTRLMAQFKKTMNSNSISVGNFYFQFFPSVFDKIAMKEVKMNGLLDCLEEKEPVPTNLVDIFISIDEYKYYPPFSQISFVVFSVLLKFFQKSNQLFDSLKEIVLKIVVQFPKFIPQVIQLLDYRFFNSNVSVVKNLLYSFEDMLLKISRSKLSNYIYLIERIVQEPTIEPSVSFIFIFYLILFFYYFILFIFIFIFNFLFIFNYFDFNFVYSNLFFCKRRIYLNIFTKWQYQQIFAPTENGKKETRS